MNSLIPNILANINKQIMCGLAGVVLPYKQLFPLIEPVRLLQIAGGYENVVKELHGDVDALLAAALHLAHEHLVHERPEYDESECDACVRAAVAGKHVAVVHALDVEQGDAQAQLEHDLVGKLLVQLEFDHFLQVRVELPRLHVHYILHLRKHIHSFNVQCSFYYQY